MNDPLYGVRLKIERAENQLGSLNAEINRFLRTQPFGMTFNFNEDTSELVGSFTVRESCPAIWGVLVGEFIHNLRSSLDQLVWQLVILRTGKPPVSNVNQFPIFLAEEGASGYQKRAIPYLKGVEESAKQLILASQPFRTGEGSTSPLWHLHELSNFDKHRTLHLTSALIDAGKIVFPPMVDGVQVGGPETEVHPAGPIEEGATLLKVKLAGPRYPFQTPKAEAKVEGRVRFNVAFDRQSPSVGGAIVVQALVAVGGRVKGIIQQIATEIFNVEPPA